MMRLETERLILRNFQEKDLPAAQEYLSDPIVMRFLEPPFSPDKARIFLEKYALTSSPLVYAVIEKESGHLAGHVIFHPYEQEDCYELGWILNRDFQGKGYALEISRSLIRFAAHRLHLRRILLEALPENTASLRVIRKLGAVFEKETDGLLCFSISCEKPLSE